MKPFIDPTLDASSVPRVIKLFTKTPRRLTAPFRLLPDFIIIGGQRCGTTTLYGLLSQHPGMFPAYRKEVHFFERNRRALMSYRAYFPLAFHRSWVSTVRGRQFVTGEATAYYLFHPHAPGRIARMLPDVKLIALLRNPVERAYSHYQHEVRKGREPLSFEDAIDAEAERLSGERERMLADDSYESDRYRFYSYLSRGIYVDQLRVWTALFPSEQLLVLSSEDLYENPRAVVARVFTYLGLPRCELDRYGNLNQARYSPMPAATRRRLTEYFEPHNQRLYEFLGRDLGWAQRARD